jgi:inhibitor of KinA sporulation pathway (predicted exonuclease)
MKIEIPDEVVEAAAKQIAGSRLPEYEWVDLDTEMKSFYRDEARAALAAALNAWPMKQHRAWDDVQGVGAFLLAPPSPSRLHD